MSEYYGYLRMDEDCHWYLIPEDFVGDFDSLMEELDEAWVESPYSEEWQKLADKFDDQFDGFRVNDPYKFKVLLD